MVEIAAFAVIGYLVGPFVFGIISAFIVWYKWG
jgi:hypothetical protein